MDVCVSSGFLKAPITVLIMYQDLQSNNIVFFALSFFILKLFVLLSFYLMCFVGYVKV